MKAIAIVGLLGCIFMLFCAVNGTCLLDRDTTHDPAEYDKRLFSYSSRQPIQPSTSSDLKFMTFNVYSGYHLYCTNNPTVQAELMRGMDFVGTQETVQGVDTRCNYCNIPQIIADTAGMNTRFVMAIPWRTGQYGTSMGTTQNILETKFALLIFPGAEQRVVAAIKTQPAALRDQFLWFVNVHVDYANGMARQSQIAQIVTFIQNEILAQDPKAAIVMTGDFNGGPWDAAYTTLKQAGFLNSWEMFSGSILLGNTIPADWPGARFDHVWYRPSSTVAITVKHVEVPNVMLSDHRPVAATLTFSVAGSSSSGPNPTNPTSGSPPTNPPANTPAPPVAGTSAPVGSRVCVGPIFENVPFVISCPNPSQKIVSVEFANYGTPTGSCGNFQKGTCVGGSSMAVMLDKCLNRPSCTFPISNHVFGDPCPGTGKRFITQVTCR